MSPDMRAELEDREPIEPREVSDSEALDLLDGPTAPPSKTFRLVHFHQEDGVRVAIVGEPGRKWIYAAVFDAPIRLLKLTLDEQKHMRDITEITVAKAAKKMRAAGKRLGITDGARKFLTEATEGVTPVTLASEA